MNTHTRTVGLTQRSFCAVGLTGGGKRLIREAGQSGMRTLFCILLASKEGENGIFWLYTAKKEGADAPSFQYVDMEWETAALRR